MGVDMMIAYLMVAIGVIGLVFKTWYSYNPKLKDMDDSQINNAIDNFGHMMSEMYSLPPINIVIEDLSKESAVYVDGPIEACFMPKDKDGSVIIIDMERLKRNGNNLSELCSVVIHEYTHYYDCSICGTVVRFAIPNKVRMTWASTSGTPSQSRPASSRRCAAFMQYLQFFWVMMVNFIVCSPP